MARVKYIYKSDAKRLHLDAFPNFSASGSVAGMKKMFYGKESLLVRSGAYIYNVTKYPEIYYCKAH